MKKATPSLVEVLANLKRCIAEAEHKPGQWVSARSQMGGISTESRAPASDSSQHTSLDREHCWASFSHKRDGWLAVAAVNALPTLIAVAEGAQALADSSSVADLGVRELLARRQSGDIELPLSPTSTMDAAKAAGAGVVQKDVGESEGAQMIVAERRRQRAVEGWTAKHDDEHTDRSLAMVCALYASPIPLYEMTGGRGSFHFVDPWPESWSGEWDRRRFNADGSHKKLTLDEMVCDLAKAGALAAAEIDRLLRMKRKAARGKRRNATGMADVGVR
jgi:hypothetical protein